MLSRAKTEKALKQFLRQYAEDKNTLTNTSSFEGKLVSVYAGTG